MHPDKIVKINGWGLAFRFITPFVGILATVLSSVVLMYLGGLKTDLLEVKAEAKSNFDKLEITAKINFNQIHTQLQNHLSYHQILDKELCERLSRVETLLNGRTSTHK